jgi:hypothetical protein
MARKIISYYNETAQAAYTDADQLVVEISNHEVVCLLKGAESQEIEGFELFHLDKGSSDWSDVFYEVRSASQLLNRTYRDAHCYYNFEEAVVIPGQRFTATSAEDYLSLLYGESDRHDIKYDTIRPDAQMVNAYRIRKSINELMGRHFVLYKPHHTYSRLLEDVLTRTEAADHFIKVQFYSHHFIVAVMKKDQLQLIQSFHFETFDDVLYHLININRQFELSAVHSHLEISGMFETGSILHKQLQPLFGLITFDGMQPDGVFKTTTQHPAHYFTPFYKLVV